MSKRLNLKITIRSVLFCLAISLIVFESCTYKNEIDEYGVNRCESTNLSYSTHIQPILKTHCYSCHADNATKGAGIQLDEFSILQAYIENDILLKSINHKPGASSMPKNALRLETCALNQISNWISEGYPQN